MTNPFALFDVWLNEAREAGAKEPTAMSLATVGADGTPSVRMVLLKHADSRGFVFYTNLGSPKVADLREHPVAALCFYWPDTKRQVRVTGLVLPVSEEEADAYFATRPRLSQIGAWASRQSEPMPSPFALETACAKVAISYAIGAVPRPPFWSGFRVAPTRLEFWTEKPFRRHERTRYTLTGSGWTAERLFP